MQIKKSLILYVIIILLIPIAMNISVPAKEDTPPHWNSQWSYKQEVILPISTDNYFTKYQPIDIQIEFNYNCWAKNEEEHSIRVVCWDGNRWYELESQIYDLKYKDINILNKCGLVFLVPDIANGEERYFIYYDDKQKPLPEYFNHVDVEDAYYYSEPISGIKMEGDYYKIIEDEHCIYGIGQKGQIYFRKLSQAVAKMELGSEEFDYTNADIIAALCFSYYDGLDDKDEISSDQELVSKELCVDGNIMAEFRIVSESSDKNLRTTNIYKYYYCPTDEKRICVNVKHEVLKKIKVKGVVNVDGRYGALVSFEARSERVQKMRFGEILPYLHVYGENDKIKEYKIDINPENKKRDWIISYEDDSDVGKDAWISYDEGINGKAHAVILSSNEKIVKSGTGEKDGIQIKCAEKEYLNIVGTEIDYVAINYGRNSFEKGGTQDLFIPDDLVVEYDMEFFTTEKNGYKGVVEESNIYHKLIKQRHKTGEEVFEEDQNIYILTVVPRFGGKIFSFPRFVNTDYNFLPVVQVELYRDDELISSGIATKPNFLNAAQVKFPKLAPDQYVVKVYRKFGDRFKRYFGVETVKLEEDTKIDVYCSWQKTIKLNYNDQYGNGIEDIELLLEKRDIVIEKNLTDGSGELTYKIPSSLFDNYNLKAFYKGFLIYDNEINKWQKKIDINIDLYELTIDIEDGLGLPPGVDVRPSLTSSKMQVLTDLKPEEIKPGKYLFRNLPEAPYELYISYGAFSDKKTIKIPTIQSERISFTAKYELTTSLYDSRGDFNAGNNQKFEIIRDGIKIYDSKTSIKSLNLPPGKYTVNVYLENKKIGSKTVELISNKDVKIVTTIEPILPVIITGLVIAFIGEIIVLLVFKKISLNTFLKLIAMALILISLFQPWWVLNASSDDPKAEKTSEMYIFPQTMVDTINYKNFKHLELAIIPELFTGLLVVLLIIVISGFFLLGFSFIPNILLKRRFSLILIFASILFLVLVALAFSFGMSMISEISLGSLQGEGTLNVVLPTGETVYMSSTWGLGNGFYLCIMSASGALIAGILDMVKKKKWSTLTRKKR